jgi:ABC-type antimicrobial peptide transport system permease subunit
MLAFLVSRRMFEIGVRMALGASRGEVLRTTLAYGLKPVLLGLALGLPAAALLSRIVEHGLFGVERFDPLSYGLGAVALLAAALLACLPAAWRASRVDPLIALRQD